MNLDSVALDVALTGLDGEHRQVGALGIGADIVLVNVDAFFHVVSRSLVSWSIRLPIHAITGTAIEFPKDLYRGPSAAGLPRCGTCV